MKLFLSQKQKYFLFVFILVLGLSSLSFIKNDGVCTLKTLKLEILQDLEDNNMLDCLRVIEPPHFKEETEHEKNRRIMAQWDTSCSFEATNSWIESLRTSFGITNLVDVNGDPVTTDADDQADLCEIIRAAASKNLFDIKNLDMRKLTDKIVDRIDCVGAPGDKEGPRICAASSGAFFNKASWTIFLKPSAIRFAGKPSFAKKTETEESNEANESLESPTVVKDLLKFDKEKLKSKGGYFAKLINKAKSITGSLVGLGSSTKGKDVKFFVSSGPVELRKTVKFKSINLKPISVPVEFIATSFSFYMISYKVNSNEILNTRFMLNGRQISESRQIGGPLMTNTISSATVMNMDPTGVDNGVSIDYKSSHDATIRNDGQETNFTMVTILFYAKNIFKYVNVVNIEVIPNPNDFRIFPDSRLVVRNDKNYDAYYLVFYNMAVLASNSTSGEMFGTVMYSSTAGGAPKEMVETMSISGPARHVSTHGAAVVKVNKDDKMKFNLGYVYSGTSNLLLTNDPNNNTVVGLSAIELPEKTKVTSFVSKKNTILTSDLTWKSLGFEAKISLDSETKILILFHFNVKVSGNPFSIRLKIGNKHAARSVMSYSDVEFAHGQGYVVETLKAGTYKFDLEFLAGEKLKGTIAAGNNPASVKLTKQVLSMTIVEFQ